MNLANVNGCWARHISDKAKWLVIQVTKPYSLLLNVILQATYNREPKQPFLVQCKFNFINIIITNNRPNRAHHTCNHICNEILVFYV